MSEFPERLGRWLKGAGIDKDDLGRSGDGVFRVRKGGETRYLKRGKGPNIRREREVLTWLEGRLPAPHILDAMEDGDTLYLVLSEVAGDVACSQERVARPEETTKLLARGIRALWKVPVDDCPLGSCLEEMLVRARGNLPQADAGEVRAAGFSSPEALLTWLEDNRPEEEPVFSHGDFCLPNILLGEDIVNGYIDWNLGGVADIHQDIAMCLWSMGYNFGTEAYGQLLLGELGVVIDQDKLRYYQLLHIL